MRLKTRDGTQLYFKDAGKGQPIVLIHGWPLSADSWEYQAYALAIAGYRVISYDRRGFGRSDQPWKGYDYDTLSDDLATLIQELGLENVILAGFSMGGGEIVRYMSRHSGRNVDRIALISSIIPLLVKATGHADGVEESVFDSMQQQILQDRPAFFSSFFKDFYGVGWLASPVSEEYLQWSRAIALQAGLDATLDCISSFAKTDFRNELSSIRVPTLLIHGTNDKTVPIEATSRLAKEAIADCRLLEYEGAPHGIPATHQRELTSDLLEFVSKRA